MNYFLYCRKSTEDEDRQVLSLQSQMSEAARAFGGSGDIQIVDRFVEARSAKRPGRPIFNDMLSRLELGEAQGVIAWAPDRLARNSVDGGQIIYLLDRGVIRDLKFVTYTFENNSQGKFMLQIMFGQSKYFSDALSENVKRGNRTKVENGWWPNHAPLGYLNDRAAKTIIADPTLFPLVRKMYDLALSGAYSCAQITRIARDEWGLRTPRRKRTGGTLTAPSTIHRILTNRFYTGSIVWGGQTYSGNHTPVVSIDEFEEVQRVLRRSSRKRAPRRAFPHTGMIRCGECGFSITAEEKVNRHGSRYLYYHCTKKRSIGPKCRQPSVTAKDLEAQLFGFLESVALDESIEEWTLRRLAAESDGQAETEEARKRSLATSIASVECESRELTGLRTRSMIDDEEFARERTRLQAEAFKLRKMLAEADRDIDRFEPLKDLISFSVQAIVWFVNGQDEDRRLILQTAGSNPVLIDKILKFEAAKPFVQMLGLVDFLRQPGVVDDVRTPSLRKSKLQRSSQPPKKRPKRRERTIKKPLTPTQRRIKKGVLALRDALDDPACEHILPNIRRLQKRFKDQAQREAA